jgi:hypothetical protein
MGGGLIVSDVDALGCLRFLRARVALDGVSWVQRGSVEIAVGQKDRMLQNRRRHLLPPVAPLGSSVRPPVWLNAVRLGRIELAAVSQNGVHDDGEAWTAGR